MTSSYMKPDIGRGQGPVPPSENIQLSTRIQCVNCNRFLMHGRYSNRQLERYRVQLRRNRGDAARIERPQCMNCTGGPATELKCSQCDITKGLEAFTKVQRRDPDNAKCKNCQQEIEDQLPNVEAQLAEMKILEELAHGGRNRGSAFSTTASLSAYSNSRSRISTSLNSSGGQVADQGDGVWVPVPTGSSIDYGSLQTQASHAQGYRSSSASASTGLTSTTTCSVANTAWGGFQQQPRPVRQPFSTRASSITDGTREGANPGFANIGAEWRHQTPAEKAAVTRAREEMKQRESHQTLPADDEDSDNESFDGPL